MGNSKNPRRPETATGTKERPANKKEVNKGQKTDSIEDYKKKADKLKSNPNLSAAESIRQLKGNLETAEQLNGLQHLHTAIVSVLAKLIKSGVDISKIDETQELKDAVNKAKINSKIKLILPEEVAVQNLDRIIREHGPTAIYIQKSWPKTIEAAQDASKGWTSKSWKYVKKNPGATMALVASGALGIYATYSLVKWALKDEEAEKKEGKESHFGKKALAAASLAVLSLFLGKFLGKSAVDKILAAAGLDADDIKDELKERGGDLSDKTKAKIDKAGPKARVAIDRVRVEAGYPPLGHEEGQEAGEEDVEAKKLEEFGENLLVNNGADKLESGIYLITTGKRKTYFRFENGKWQWCSETEKKNAERAEKGETLKKGEEGWHDAPDDPYKAKAMAKVNKIARILAQGKEDATDEGKEARKGLKEDVERMVAVEGPLVLLIEIFYYNDFDFSDADKTQIGDAVEVLRRNKVKVSDVLSLWSEYTNKNEIPNQNSLGTFGADIEKRNIYRAIKMIALTAQEYWKRSKLDYSKVTVEDFLEKHLAKDPIQKMHNAAQQSIIESVKNGGIMDILSFNNINLKKVQEQLAELAKDGWKDLAKDFGIDLASLNKNEKEHFVIMLTYLQSRTRISQEWGAVIKESGFPKNANEKTMAAMKVFYNEIQAKTIDPIIKAAVKRFNLGPNDVNNSDNADIIKNNLKPNRIDFKHALYLNLVTRKLDLSKPATKGGSGPQEMSFLFTILSSLTEDQKVRYTSELINAITEYPERFPSLALIAPYLTLAADFGINYVKRKLHHLSSMASAMMPNRSLEQQEKWLRKMKDKPIWQWTMGTAKEGTFGALAIGWEVIDPMIKSGLITYEEIGQCEGPWDFIMLIKKAGGTLIYNEDAKGNPHGWIHLAGSVFVFRPYGAVKETLSAAFLQGDPGGALKVWTAGVAPFVTYGAIKGYYLAKWTEFGHLPLTKFTGALKGGAKMYIGYPYYALKKSANMAKYSAEALVNMPKAIPEIAGRPIRAAQRAGRGAMDFVRYRSLWPGQNVPNMLENGKRLAHYMESSDFKHMDWGEIFSNLKESDGRKLMLRRLQKGFDNTMVIRYSKRFADDYNHFFKFDKASTRRLRLTDILQGSVGDAAKGADEMGGEIGRALESYKRIKGFLENSGKHKAVFNKMAKLMGKNLDRAKLQNKLQKVLKKIGHLSAEERSALVGQLRNKDDVLRLQKRIESGLRTFGDYTEAASPAKRGALASKIQEKLGKLKKRFRKPSDIESGRSFGKTGKALKNTQKELSAVQKQVATAEKEIGLLNRMRRGPKIKKWDAKLQARLDTARQIISDGKAAEAKLNRTIKALGKVKKAEAAIDAAKEASKTGSISSKYLKKLLSTQDAAQDALSASSKATKNIGKLGKVGSVMKWGGRAAGGVGVLFSAYEMRSAFSEAWSTDIAERKTIKYAESGLWAFNVAADSAAVAVMFGSTSGLATAGSAVALPLIPLTYAATTVGETLYEGTKTDYEWAQKGPYEALHHFYTSVNSISLGDAWIGSFKAMGRSPVQLGMTLLSPGGTAAAAALGSDFSFETKGQKEAWDKSYEESLKTKVGTMHKIYRGLVAIQKNPMILDYLNSTPPPKEKDKKVEQLIKDNYSVYHEFYFREMTPTGMQSYGSAQKFILEAQMYHDIMTMRDQQKKNNKPFTIGGKGKTERFSLHLPRYDVIGGMDNPKARVIYSPSQVVKAYKEDATREFKRDEIIWDNLERMDTGYLLRLCAQIELLLEDDRKSGNKIDPKVVRDLKIEVIALQKYLEMVRGINYQLGIRKKAAHEPRMDLNEIRKHVNSIGSAENKAFQDFEKDQFTITPALHAIKKLAEYFGYTGSPSESKLKEFFNENAASYHGLYWDGEEWMLQERGNEFDDSFGPALTSEMIEQIITRMQEQPDNILEHRSDTIFLDAYDYEMEVKKMAGILAGGLAEGNERGYKRSKLEPKKKKATPLEHLKHFDPKKIDYSQSKEALMGDYKEVIEYTKKETTWSQLEYKIKDDKTITLSRGDGNATVELTRSGSAWNMGGFKGGLSLIQAVALGNLKNWAEQWLTSNKETGGSKRPFEIDGDMIDFDASGTPFDTTFMKGWVGFYSNIGVSKAKAVNTLNNWFEKEGTKG